MLRRYLDVLRLPHALRVFLPAQLGKLAFTMVTLAIILAVQHATDSFTAAGAATGAFGIANVAAAPWRARLVDRRGQRFALSGLVLVFGGAMIALFVVTSIPAPAVWLIVVLALVTGLSAPPLGAAMRVLWSDLAPTPELAARAYSLDAVAEEVLFTLGPFVVAIVVAIAGPPAGLLATAVAAVAGTLVMVSGTASRQREAVVERPPAASAPLRQPRFIPLLVALLGVGLVIGAAEVAVPAAAAAFPTIVTGVLMAMMPIGSGTGGLVYGHVSWRSRSVVRLAVIAFGIAVICALLALAPNLVVLGAVLIAVGVFIAPALITGYVLVDELTVPEVRTEAFSWVNTATNLGAAAASAIGGWLVDHSGASASFAFGAGAAAVCALIAAPLLLRRSRSLAKRSAGR